MYVLNKLWIANCGLQILNRLQRFDKGTQFVPNRTNAFKVCKSEMININDQC